MVENIHSKKMEMVHIHLRSINKMSEKTQLEVLCMDKIPRLLRGEPASDVFKEPAKEIRACNAFCPEYYSIKGFTNTNLCEQDLQTVFLPDCRLGYPPIAQRSPKCTGNYPHPFVPPGIIFKEEDSTLIQKHKG